MCKPSSSLFVQVHTIVVTSADVINLFFALLFKTVDRRYLGIPPYVPSPSPAFHSWATVSHLQLLRPHLPLPSILSELSCSFLEKREPISREQPFLPGLLPSFLMCGHAIIYRALSSLEVLSPQGLQQSFLHLRICLQAPALYSKRPCRTVRISSSSHPPPS